MGEHAPDPFVPSPAENPDMPDSANIDPAQTVEAERAAYMRKVGLVASTLREATERSIEAERVNILGAVGGETMAAWLDLWALHRRKGLVGAKREFGRLLFGDAMDVLDPRLGEEPYDQVMASIIVSSQSMLGVSPEHVSEDATDVTPVDPVNKLAELIGDDRLHEDESGALVKVTGACRLLVAQGLCELYGANDARQLSRVLRLIELYTDQVPEFEPEEAGLRVARTALVKSVAALQLNRETKQTTDQSDVHLHEAILSCLETIRLAEAHVFVSEYDIPDPALDGS